MVGAAPVLLLLGPVQWLGAGRAEALLLGADRRSQLLVLLGLEAGRWVERDRIAALLWPGHEPGEARRNLRKVVFKARELPGMHGLQVDDHALRWDVLTDVAQLRRATADQDGAAVVALLRGPPLGGLDQSDNAAWTDWLRDERSRLLTAWQQAAHAQLDCGGPSAGPAAPAPEGGGPARARAAATEALAHRMLEADPLDETAVRALLQLQTADGRWIEARRTYRDYAARLADEFGVDPSSALASLLEPRPPPAPAAVAAAAPALARPAADAFVGRRLELQALHRLYFDEGARLVVLTGPGGVGKSRLAREWLLQARDRVPAATTHWIELQHCADDDLLPRQLAQRLGLPAPDGDDPVAALAGLLGAEPQRLVVLDNAEHLAGLAPLLERLVAANAAVRWLVTSRVRLQAGGARPLALAGLDVPDDASRDAEAAAAFDAVRLFAQRASAVQPAFELTRQLPEVIDIVLQVGGLPLAIELAASWVRLLPPREIAADLRASIALLERDTLAAAPARPEHASMQAVLDRSLALLAPRECEALLALAVFRGGFSALAAREVAAVPLPLLSSLVDNAMLQVDDGGRFALHPLLAREALARAEGDAPALQRRRLRHGAYFARRAVELLEEFRSQPGALVQAFEADLANAELAWQQAVDGGAHERLQQALPTWRAYFLASGRFAQAVRHFERALAIGSSPAAAEAPALLQAQLKAALAYFLIRNFQPERAADLAAQALAVAERLGAAALEQECVGMLGGTRMALGAWAEAYDWIARALALAERLGLRRDQASAHNNLGLAATLLGRFGPAREHLQQAVALHRELGNTLHVARAMSNLGFVELARGAWGEALVPLEAARAYARAHGVGAIASETEMLLGAARIEMAELEAAERHFERAAEAFRAERNAGFLFKCEVYLARIAARRAPLGRGLPALVQALRRARAERLIDDELYVAAFLGELLHRHGHAAEADRLLAAARAAPHADASVRSVVDACRPAGAAALPASETVPPFAALADACAQALDPADLARRLRAAA